MSIYVKSTYYKNVAKTDPNPDHFQITSKSGRNDKIFLDMEENIVGEGGNVCYLQITSKSRRKDKIFLDWEENITGKGGNAGNQHFLLFP